MRNPFQIAGFALVLVLALAAGLYAWRMIGETQISLLGWIAIASPFQPEQTASSHQQPDPAHGSQAHGPTK